MMQADNLQLCQRSTVANARTSDTQCASTAMLRAHASADERMHVSVTPRQVNRNFNPTSQTHLDSLPLPVKQELQGNEALNISLVPCGGLSDCCWLPLPDGQRPLPPPHVFCIILYTPRQSICAYSVALDEQMAKLCIMQKDWVRHACTSVWFMSKAA